MAHGSGRLSTFALTSYSEATPSWVLILAMNSAHLHLGAVAHVAAGQMSQMLFPSTIIHRVMGASLNISLFREGSCICRALGRHPHIRNVLGSKALLRLSSCLCHKASVGVGQLSQPPSDRGYHKRAVGSFVLFRHTGQLPSMTETEQAYLIPLSSRTRKS